MRITGLIGLICGLAACGNGESAGWESLAGMYQTTRHTLNQEGCASQGPEVSGMPYFQFVREELLGVAYLSFGSCESAEESSCSSGGLFSAWMQEGGEIRHEVQMASGGGDYGPCSLSIVLGSLTALDDSVSLEILTHREEDPGLSEEDCSTDEAEARGTGMPCVRYEVIEGTRVP